MPVYEYRCNECRKKFSAVRSVTDKKKPKCPKCSSRKVTQLITGFYSQTSKKS